MDSLSSQRMQKKTHFQNYCLKKKIQITAKFGLETSSEN